VTDPLVLTALIERVLREGRLSAESLPPDTTLARIADQFTAMGMEVECAPHELRVSPLDWLRAEAIPTPWLELRRVVDSTQTALVQAAVPVGQKRGLVAEYQTAGRGRLGRRWLNPIASGLTLSIAASYSAAFDPSALAPLPLMVGIELAERLNAHAAVSLKWPNDLVLQGAKVAGILCESRVLEGATTVVVGLGINGPLRTDDHRQIAALGGALAATSLDLRHHSRNALLQWSVEAICAALDAASTHEGFGAYQSRFHALDALNGREVRWLVNGAPCRGLAQGVDAEGRLKVRTDRGVVAIHSGEVERGS
jgi:BirA family biotin operon repressor/biotin-[acetyl-CoA-carboxylase] ligase